MFIQIEDTPNPHTLKFMPQGPVMANGVYPVKCEEMASRSPLAQKLWALPGVNELLFGKDFISVTKEPSTEWFKLKPSIVGLLMEHFVTQAPLFIQDAMKDDLEGVNEGSSGDDQGDEGVIREITDLIDQRVRPAVAMDGGDITFERFEEGIVYVSLKGACSGCPSATATLKSGIETMLKHYIPEVVEVRAL